MEALVVVPVSQAAADQRAGRSGRQRPGVCYRLYTEVRLHIVWLRLTSHSLLIPFVLQEAYQNLRVNAIPEMQRTDLAPVVLQLKALGIDNVIRFDFVTPPPAQSMMRALEVQLKAYLLVTQMFNLFCQSVALCSRSIGRFWKADQANRLYPSRASHWPSFGQNGTSTDFWNWLEHIWNVAISASCLGRAWMLRRSCYHRCNALCANGVCVSSRCTRYCRCHAEEIRSLWRRHVDMAQWYK